MLFGSGPLISGAGIATGMFVVAAFAACAAMAIFAIMAFRRGGDSRMQSALWGGGLVLGSVLLAALLFERVLSRDLATERRVIEARASELAARAIAPGS